MKNYTLKQLRYFAAAARVDSVTKAADNVHISQPSISAAIANLEQNFGLQLFFRHHAQGLSLTPDGRNFLTEALRLLSSADDFGLYADELGGVLKGSLEVGCFSSVAAILMPGLIRSYCNQNKEVTINSHEGYQEQLVKGLLDGSFGQVLTFDLDIGNEIEFEPLVTLPPYVIMSFNNPLSNKEAISLSELMDQSMIFLDLPLSRDYFKLLFSQLGLEPKVSHKVESIQMASSMVANDFGYSLSNIVHLQSNSLNYEKRFGLKTLEGKQYCAIPLIDELPPLTLGLARLKQSRLTRKAEAFEEFCKDYFSGPYLSES